MNYLCFFCIIILCVFKSNSVLYYNGFNFLNGQWSAPKYNSTDAENEIIEMFKQTGNTCVQLTFAWYQDTINDTYIYPNNSLTPSDNELKSISAYILSKIGCVVFRPCIIVLNNNGGQDSHQNIGEYFTTSQWNTWFGNYSYFINYYAKLANEVNANQFVIGRELVISTKQTDKWVNLINNIQNNNYYNGKLRYDAINGNENNIEFWSSLDYIGIDGYYSLDNTTQSPSYDDLVDAWKPITNNLVSLSKKYNKGIIFGEIGYCSSYGTNINPDKCEQSGEPLSIEAQNNCYVAFIQSAGVGQSYYKGVFFWYWLTNPNDKGTLNIGYTVNDKPAAGYIKYYWG